MLSGRDVHDCETCHLEKQLRKPFKKSLKINIIMPNQLVCADLLVPGISCGTKAGAILVFMDACSKFVTTTYMLRTKAVSAADAALKQYFAWAERQASRHTRAAYPVRQLLTDKGGEFVSSEFEQ